MATKTRNRVIYQSEALYVGQPSATGAHITATVEGDSKLYGLILDPNKTSNLCMFNNVKHWDHISTPVDPNTSSTEEGSRVQMWNASTTYVAGDIVWMLAKTDGDLENDSSENSLYADPNSPSFDSSRVWFFEAKTAYDNSNSPVVNNDKKPLQSLEDKFSGKSFDKFDIQPAVRQLNRIQNANYSFSYNRQDVNQFGQLHRIDSVAIEPPTVSLDFSYYLTNGANENLMGFKLETLENLEKGQAKNFINTKEQEDDFEGRNYFILTTPQGEDAVGNDGWNADGSHTNAGQSTIALGNGYVTNYSIEASVGAMPTASVTVEGLNLKSDNGMHNIDIPAVDNSRGTPIEGVKHFLPLPVSGVLDDSGHPIEDDGTCSVASGTILDATGTVSSEDVGGNGHLKLVGISTSFTTEFAVGDKISTEGNSESEIDTIVSDTEMTVTTALTPVSASWIKNKTSGTTTDGKYSTCNGSDEGNAVTWTGQAAGDGDHSGQADGFSCLRPGDVEMHLGTNGRAGVMTNLPAGTAPTDHTIGSCHVQSFSIELPMGRTPLQRLGTPYAYTRPLDFPITVNISVSAIVSDLKQGNIADSLFEFENHDLHFILREPQIDGAGPVAMGFYVRGAQLEGESFSSSIGDNKTVDLTFTAQVGGPEDLNRGLMICGSRGAVGSTFLNRFDPDSHAASAIDESWKAQE
jgi:hypothetical protein